jgi:hypothetical protein
MNKVIIHANSYDKCFHLKLAADWAIKKLMPRQNNLVIHIKFKRMKEWGMCEPIFWERSPKEFYIDIKNDLNIKSSTRVLFHELTHVRQYATNKLRDVNSKTMWLKEDHTDTPYLEQPWEIEASALEDELFNAYFDK